MRDERVKTFISGLKNDYSKIAKEPVNVEIVNEVVYALGSEIATLRLYRAYDKNRTQGYSPNLKTFYFGRELPEYMINIINGAK
jgi:hypothetical protein